MLLLSALRQEDGCAERLACRLGDLAKESFQDRDLVLGEEGVTIGERVSVCRMYLCSNNSLLSCLGAVNLVMPDEYSKFSRSFEKVMRDEDRQACHKECFRCFSFQ